MGVWGKRLATVLACAVACFALAACAHSDNAAEEAKDNLPEIRIGVDALEPFFYMGRDGNYTGIDADIATEACKRAGLKPVFVPISWGDRDTYLADGSVDCLWTAFAKDGREDEYAWTDSYLQSNLAVLVSTRSPATSLDDFSGPGGIAVRANSLAEKIVFGYAASDESAIDRVHSYSTYSMAEASFIKSYSDALVSHEFALQGLIDKYPGAYRFLDRSIARVDLAVAFPKEYSGTNLTALDDALASMKADGTIAAIASSYGLDESSNEGEADGE